MVFLMKLMPHLYTVKIMKIFEIDLFLTQKHSFSTKNSHFRVENQYDTVCKFTNPGLNNLHERISINYDL